MRSDEHVRKKVHISGVVQGVGFRPFLWQVATRFGLTGWVKNDTTGVTMEVQGTGAQLNQFLNAIEEQVPPLAVIQSIASNEIPVKTESGFSILKSSSNQNQSTPIAADISVCNEE